MPTVTDVFNQGPQAPVEWLSHQSGDHSVDAMDIKELADICWTRASTLAKGNRTEAREWAKAALAGYEYLSERREAFVAESARESVIALRSWRLLTGESPVG